MSSQPDRMSVPEPNVPVEADVPPVNERPTASRKAVIRRAGADGQVRPRSELLATEEPFDIRINAEGHEIKATVTMRTPGNDFELATGFLYAESVLGSKDDLSAVRYCQPQAEQQYNVVTVDLRGPMPEMATLDRMYYSGSGCGVCGKASIDRTALLGIPAQGEGPRVAPELLLSLPERLQKRRKLFDRTGGVHGAGVFDGQGNLECAREDVGALNAVDKVVGWALLQDRLPLADRILVVSGRAGYDLVQKALRAGAGILCADGAPSTLAVDLAARFGLTLIGYRSDGIDIYSGERRVG
ncbi:MAG TPA: formate dehydrogenase accessory sulfurtransferase FdhD [Actinomycetota bacterium]|nr:formate dehydrogenase accessory sulfurtransferase FdhD [Actinomycetota bacterium]